VEKILTCTKITCTKNRGMKKKILNLKKHDLLIATLFTHYLTAPYGIILSYKDKKSADVVHKQPCDLRRKIDNELNPIFRSKEIINDLRETEFKPPITSRVLFMN